MPAVPCRLSRSSAPEVDQSLFINSGNQSRNRDLTARNSANLSKTCQSGSAELFNRRENTRAFLMDGFRSFDNLSLTAFSA